MGLAYRDVDGEGGFGCGEVMRSNTKRKNFAGSRHVSSLGFLQDRFRIYSSYGFERPGRHAKAGSLEVKPPTTVGDIDGGNESHQGAVAKRSCGGLQSRSGWFDSSSRLQIPRTDVRRCGCAIARSGSFEPTFPSIRLMKFPRTLMHVSRRTTRSRAVVRGAAGWGTKGSELARRSSLPGDPRQSGVTSCRSK